jgi:DNA-binding transcriptional MerR regulator
MIDQGGKYLNDAKTWNSATVSRMTGATLRQLQWWDEQGLVWPRIDGHTRRYTAAQFQAVRLVIELRRKGVPLSRIRNLLPKLKLESAVGSLLVTTNYCRTFKLFSQWADAIEFAWEAAGPVIVVEIPEPPE